jgi:serine/threonine protein kinase
VFVKGKVLGYYKILERMDAYPRLQAYKARDLERQRVVCLLTPADAAARRQDSIQRIMTLATTLQRLDYPGIAQVYDQLQAENRYFLVMEFIPGCNLEKLLQSMHQNQGRPRLDEALGVFLQVLSATTFLKDYGASSRSLDPQWIYFRPEPCQHMPFCSVLADPGVGFLPIGRPAKSRHSQETRASSGDANSQITQLGVLLYRLVTGRLLTPEAAENPGRLLGEHPDMPENVAAVIMRLLSHDPEVRMEDLGGVAAELLDVDTQVTQISSSSLGRPESLMPYYLDSLVKERSGPSVAPAENNEHDRIQINGPGTGKQVVAMKRDGMTIGRVAGNDIVLNDLLVSRLHARIQYEDSSYQVIDLNSTNGTFLGEQKLLPGVAEGWRPGTLLRLGDSVLRLLTAKRE